MISAFNASCVLPYRYIWDNSLDNKLAPMMLAMFYHIDIPEIIVLTIISAYMHGYNMIKAQICYPRHIYMVEARVHYTLLVEHS